MNTIVSLKGANVTHVSISAISTWIWLDTDNNFIPTVRGKVGEYAILYQYPNKTTIAYLFR